MKHSAGRGVYGGGDRTSFTCALTRDADNMLKELATHEHRSKTNMVEYLIRRAYRNRKQLDLVFAPVEIDSEASHE